MLKKDLLNSYIMNIPKNSIPFGLSPKIIKNKTNTIYEGDKKIVTFSLVENTKLKHCSSLSFYENYKLSTKDILIKKSITLVSSKDYYDIARFYHHAIKRTSDSYFQARLIHESIRNLFSWCLHKTLEEPARKNVIYHHLRRRFTKHCLRQLIGCSGISFWYKLIYTGLACCPSVYCKYRIWRDPSLGNL